MALIVRPVACLVVAFGLVDQADQGLAYPLAWGWDWKQPSSSSRLRVLAVGSNSDVRGNVISIQSYCSLFRRSAFVSIMLLDHLLFEITSR